MSAAPLTLATSSTNGVVRFFRQSARRGVAHVRVGERRVIVTGIPTPRDVVLRADGVLFEYITTLARRDPEGVPCVRFPDGSPSPAPTGGDCFEPFVSHRGVDVFTDFGVRKFTLIADVDDYGVFPRYGLPVVYHAGTHQKEFTLEQIDPVLRAYPEIAPCDTDDWEPTEQEVEFSKQRLIYAIDAGVLQAGGRVDLCRSRMDLWPDAAEHRLRRERDERQAKLDHLLLHPYKARKTPRSDDRGHEPLDEYISEVFDEDFVLAEKARSVSRRVVEEAQRAMQRERERRRAKVRRRTGGFLDDYDEDSHWSLNVYEDGESECARFVVTGSDGEWSREYGGDGRCTPIYVRCGVPIDGSSYHTLSTYRCELHGISTLAI